MNEAAEVNHTVVIFHLSTLSRRLRLAASLSGDLVYRHRDGRQGLVGGVVGYEELVRQIGVRA